MTLNSHLEGQEQLNAHALALNVYSLSKTVDWSNLWVETKGMFYCLMRVLLNSVF